MQIDHIHFYVEDAIAWRDWFVEKLGFQSIGSGCNHHTQTELIATGAIHFALSSALDSTSPVAKFLSNHPPGVVDVALRVKNLGTIVEQATCHQHPILYSDQSLKQHPLKWIQLPALGTLQHTLIEVCEPSSDGLEHSAPSCYLPDLPYVCCWAASTLHSHSLFTDIDHVVLNVGAGELETAADWYQSFLGFQVGQSFAIQTEYSALRSQVLHDRSGQVVLPINEPTSANSQIQEFLDLNGLPGIQHIALKTNNIFRTTQHLRQNGLTLIDVPFTYYQSLFRLYPSLTEATCQQFADHQVLVDWQEQGSALLLQTFTQPIFSQPTFFLEVIERQPYWQNGKYQQVAGFGERNFQALVEAIEQAQMKRGMPTD